MGTRLAVSLDEAMVELSREQRLAAAFVALADTLIEDFDVIDLMHTLVDACVSVLDVQAAGLVLVDPAGELRLLASTSARADLVEILQLNAGAGPCVDCFESGRAVAVDDIAASGDEWPEFRAAAAERGFRSVYAVPMRLRGQVLGALNLFGSAPRALNAPDARAAQALADVATIGLLQERGIRETTIVAEQLQRALESRVIIEQAKGVVSAAGRIGVDEAFSILRGHARRHNLTLHTVAAGVTARTIDVLGDADLARS